MRNRENWRKDKCKSTKQRKQGRTTKRRKRKWSHMECSKQMSLQRKI